MKSIKRARPCKGLALYHFGGIMDKFISEILVEQIKEKGISVRELHAQIEKICEKDTTAQWISLSTLERRFQHPKNITEAELPLIRDAMKSIVSGSLWMHVKRHITEELRYKYASQIEEAVSKGFALHQRLADYDNSFEDTDFVTKIRNFYRDSPENVRKRWLEILPIYLGLPDIAKASLLCCSYIGKSVDKNDIHNQKILKFMDYFPIFQGINIISRISDEQIASLSGILNLASTAIIPADVPNEYRRYAIDKSLIPVEHNISTSVTNEERFMAYVIRYRASIRDFLVTPEDFIRGICFTLFIDRVEWLLAYTTSIVYYDMKETRERLKMDREYHDRGCTGFRFTDNELDYLCSLIYVLEN